MTNIKKILIVEDSPDLRDAIASSLEDEGYKVFQAENGSAAKDIIFASSLDIILSDIQMPHFTGVELCNWVQENQPTPVVLMSGFLQLLEAREAAESGAIAFLNKPFRIKQLLEFLNKFFDEGEAEEEKKSSVKTEEDFCKVSISEFISEKRAEYEVFLKLREKKFVRISHAGGKLSQEQVDRYRSKGLDYLYVKKEDFSRVVGFNLNFSKLVNASSAISAEKKSNFMIYTSNCLMENVFINDVDEKAAGFASEFVVNSLDTISRDDGSFRLLDLLNQHSDALYVHSLGVSSFSVMIAKAFGWDAIKTLFEVSYSALFHDIGKKEISVDVLEKKRSQLTLEERQMVESHAMRGKKIIEDVKSIPSVVARVCYEHHEDCLGQGYPMGKKKSQVHPYSRIVATANIFCNHVLRSNHASGMAPLEALDLMSGVNADAVDAESLEALKSLFKKDT